MEDNDSVISKCEEYLEFEKIKGEEMEDKNPVSYGKDITRARITEDRILDAIFED